MKDRDGSFRYSKVISIQTETHDGKAAFRIAPNPVQAEMHVIFSQMPDTEFDLRITDMTGRLVYEQHYSDWGAPILTIPMEKISSGNYMVSIHKPNAPIQSVRIYRF
jgi:hypothetical protein